MPIISSYQILGYFNSFFVEFLQKMYDLLHVLSDKRFNIIVSLRYSDPQPQSIFFIIKILFIPQTF